MPIYSMAMVGRKKPVLLRAKSLAEAKTSLVDGESLSAEEVEEALDKGAKLWKAGETLPADEAPAGEGGE